MHDGVLQSPFQQSRQSLLWGKLIILNGLTTELTVHIRSTQHRAASLYIREVGWLRRSTMQRMQCTHNMSVAYIWHARHCHVVRHVPTGSMVHQPHLEE